GLPVGLREERCERAVDASAGFGVERVEDRGDDVVARGAPRAERGVAGALVGREARARGELGELAARALPVRDGVDRRDEPRDEALAREPGGELGPRRDRARTLAREGVALVERRGPLPPCAPPRGRRPPPPPPPP